MMNILIPTDFSENSWNAIVYGLLFFKNIQCRFYILHVSGYEKTDNATVSHPKNNFLDQIMKNDKEKLQRLLDRIEQLPINNNHRFFTSNDYIFFIDSIKKQIEEKSIDFIVMGSRGGSGHKKITVGSNTADVITKVKCPVMVIPEKAVYKKPREIAFPTDYNLQYKDRVLHTIAKVLQINDAALRVLHIARKKQELSKLQKENRRFLHAYLHKASDLSFHFLSNSNIEEAMQSFVESSHIDMITMVAKNLNFFQHILFYPTIEKINYHTHVPFLVVHE
ncbi:universal stress protein [Aquimarina sp. U1-2]|uniref:universal stress protein n=1 Tax=Aquimarina sp. U1-2 TaxID=2823141 RepID=UPI001AEC85D1|nr:universal stress protein [Aquimarina sp. U1-2]MBP2831479.1 universal stress protein [Aquimarina sp. U1-2]